MLYKEIACTWDKNHKERTKQCVLAKCSVLILKQVVALGCRGLMTGYLKIVVEVGVV